MKLYQYAVLYVPRKKEKEENKPKVLVPITEVIAADDSQVMIIASRAIPEEYLTKLEEVQIAVRPF